MLGWLARRLKDPRMDGVDIDGPERIAVHRRILGDKPMMRSVFADFYAVLFDLERRHLAPGDGLRVELGAGTSLIHDYDPTVVTTDVVHSPALDRVLDAQDMDLADGSVRTFFAINCFHHIPEPERFFAELVRTLRPGGGCILIEPWHGPVSALVHGAIHADEGFDRGQAEWSLDQGPMAGANQALSYVVFDRDEARFRARFPELRIVHRQRVDNYLRYLLSGGVNFRQLLPDAAIGPLRWTERRLAPLNRALALHHVVVLRREGVADAGIHD